MLRLLLCVITSYTIASCTSSITPSPTEIAEACADPKRKLPSTEELLKEPSKLLFIRAENARLAGEIVVTQRVLGMPVDPCDHAESLHELRLLDLARSQAALGR